MFIRNKIYVHLVILVRRENDFMGTKISLEQVGQDVKDFVSDKIKVDTISVDGNIIEPDENKNVDLNFPQSLPASDVYDWAKQPYKPKYNFIEVGADEAGSANKVKIYVDNRLKDLIGTSPENLDTIYELADAVTDNKEVIEVINDAITKKVDKIEGKGLSSNDLTNEMIDRWNAKLDFSDLQDVTIDIDDELSTTSENAVQNKVITAKFAELEQKIALKDCAPVGTIISFLGVNAPTGYLKCDGTTYNISQYQELANHFISNFGSANYFGGNGTSTFAVPDLRGEFLRGTGTASRNTGSGENVGLHQDGTKLPSIGSMGNETDGWIGVLAGSGSINPTLVETRNDIDKKGGSSLGIFLGNNSNRGADYKNKSTWFVPRPTNTSVLYCIKYKKVVEIV